MTIIFIFVSISNVLIIVFEIIWSNVYTQNKLLYLNISIHSNNLSSTF